jgi:hypothetical protein
MCVRARVRAFVRVGASLSLSFSLSLRSRSSALSLSLSLSTGSHGGENQWRDKPEVNGELDRFHSHLMELRQLSQGSAHPVSASQRALSRVRFAQHMGGRMPDWSGTGSDMPQRSPPAGPHGASLWRTPDDARDVSMRSARCRIGNEREEGGLKSNLCRRCGSASGGGPQKDMLHVQQPCNPDRGLRETVSTLLFTSPVPGSWLQLHRRRRVRYSAAAITSEGPRESRTHACRGSEQRAAAG